MKNPFKAIVGHRTKLVALAWGIVRCLVAFGVIDLDANQLKAVDGIAGAIGAYTGIKHIDNKGN